MFSEYRMAGSAASLQKMRVRIEFRRVYGCWPDRSSSKLARDVEAEIELLVQHAKVASAEIATRPLRQEIIRWRRRQLERQRGLGPLRSN